MTLRGHFEKVRRLFRAATPQSGVVTTGELLNRLTCAGRHEREIIAHLGGDNVRFDGEKPVFDFPLVLLAFTNRSGSTLLAEYLCQSGAVYGLGEFSNHDFVKKQTLKAGLETFPDLIRHLEKGRGGRPLFGLKVSWDQLAMLIRWNIPAMFSGVRVVHILRQDILGQAVSMSIASQTQQWTSKQPGLDIEPKLNVDALDALITHQQQADTQLQLLAGAFDLPYYQIHYAGLCHNPGPNIQSVLRFCGAPQPDWKPQTPTLGKQSGPVADAFRAKYLEQVRRHILSSEKPD